MREYITLHFLTDFHDCYPITIRTELIDSIVPLPLENYTGEKDRIGSRLFLEKKVLYSKSGADSNWLEVLETQEEIYSKMYPKE